MNSASVFAGTDGCVTSTVGSYAMSVIDRVHAAAAKALQNEAVLARLATSGSLPIGAGPEQLDAHIRREIARWDKVLKAAGVQLK